MLRLAAVRLVTTSWTFVNENSPLWVGEVEKNMAIIVPKIKPIVAPPHIAFGLFQKKDTSIAIDAIIVNIFHIISLRVYPAS